MSIVHSLSCRIDVDHIDKELSVSRGGNANHTFTAGNVSFELHKTRSTATGNLNLNRIEHATHSLTRLIRRALRCRNE